MAASIHVHLVLLFTNNLIFWHRIGWGADSILNDLCCTIWRLELSAGKNTPGCSRNFWLGQRIFTVSYRSGSTECTPHVPSGFGTTSCTWGIRQKQRIFTFYRFCVWPWNALDCRSVRCFVLINRVNIQVWKSLPIDVCLLDQYLRKLARRWCR